MSSKRLCLIVINPIIHRIRIKKDDLKNEYIISFKSEDNNHKLF